MGPQGIVREVLDRLGVAVNGNQLAKREKDRASEMKSHYK